MCYRILLGLDLSSPSFIMVHNINRPISRLYYKNNDGDAGKFRRWQAAGIGRLLKTIKQ